MLPAVNRPSRAFYIVLVALFIGAGAWRVLSAATLPAISRDGATFCWYARDLGQQGLSYLRTPPAQQHPLFPALILTTQRVARTLGAPDTPLTWQRSGQVVCGLAGLAVIALVGLLTIRLVRQLGLPLDDRRTALLAMLLAAVLPLNVWLSCDVMSGQIHLAFYLAAVCWLVKLDAAPAALGCGLSAGLAFLTRQEGAVPVLAGLVVLVAQRKRTAGKKLVSRAALLLLGFLVCAAPYWSIVGRFSTKKSLFEGWAEETALALPSGPESPGEPLTMLPRASAPALAKLETQDLPWYGLAPHALYKLFRAGRVVVPLLALFPLINLRKRLFGPTLIGPAACATGHFTLTLALLAHHGYLSTRHMLVPTMLLVPLAAMLLARVLTLLLDLRRPVVGALMIAVCVWPLVAYALRTPNAPDRFLVEAAQWLRRHDPELASKRLLSGSSPKRIAFYADMRWEPWWEQPEHYGALSRQIQAGGPGYFAVEVGPGFERAGNAQLVERLSGDDELAPYLGAIRTRPGPDADTTLYLIELRAPPP